MRLSQAAAPLLHGDRFTTVVAPGGGREQSGDIHYGQSVRGGGEEAQHAAAEMDSLRTQCDRNVHALQAGLNRH